jgi:hypothetical protein
MKGRHSIPGARKRRDRRHGAVEPTGWVRAEVVLYRKRDRWVHPDGRWFEGGFGGNWLSHDGQLFVDMTRHLGKGASHPARFRDQLPF